MSRLWRSLAACAAAACCIAAHAQAEYAPPSGKGRVVVVLSGQLGAGHYIAAARQIAEMGYDVTLLDGNDYRGEQGEAIKDAIAKATQSAHALPGKVAVVGFSLGGGEAIGRVARWPDLVAGIVVMYPLTAFVEHPDRFVASLKVPVLMLAGEADTYKDCCRIEKARAIADAASTSQHQPPFELVTYPRADHDFIMPGRSYNGAAAGDAWKRTEARLREYFAGS
ncbi:MAG: dienelactone hydrolase family protein [Proteobacteria bacterium]|nr:dienelactone hydrolase family protein [Pseudomonadota bacterium]